MGTWRGSSVGCLYGWSRGALLVLGEVAPQFGEDRLEELEVKGVRRRGRFGVAYRARDRVAAVPRLKYERGG